MEDESYIPPVVFIPQEEDEVTTALLPVIKNDEPLLPRDCIALSIRLTAQCGRTVLFNRQQRRDAGVPTPATENHSTTYGLHSITYGLHSTTYGLHSTTYGLHSTTYGLHSTTYGLHSTINGLISPSRLRQMKTTAPVSDEIGITPFGCHRWFCHPIK